MSRRDLTAIQRHGENAMHWLASLQAVDATAQAITVNASCAVLHLTAPGRVAELLDRRGTGWRVTLSGAQLAELEAGVFVLFDEPARAEVPA